MGYDYIFSKRTNLYAQVTNVHNQANLQTGLGGSGHIGGSTAYPGASAQGAADGRAPTFSNAAAGRV